MGAKGGGSMEARRAGTAGRLGLPYWEYIFIYIGDDEVDMQCASVPV